MIAMVGVLDDASKALGSQFRENSDRILILGSTDPTELGGSEYLAVVHGLECGQLPNLDYALELRVAECIRELIDRSLLRSCHDVGVGGLALAFAECCLGQYWSVGARIELEPGASGTDSRPDGVLFAETGARYIASFSPSNEAEVRDLASKHGVDVSFSGDVGGDVIEIGGYARLELAQARDVWSSGLDRVL